MKRVICLLLIACFMVAALVSCGGGTSDPQPGTQAPSGQVTDTQEPTGTLPSTDETGTPTESETVTETVTDDTEAPATDAPATDATDEIGRAHV